MPIQTGDNKFGVAKWIVDPVAGQGTHTTIASAIASASSGETIFIRPGTYTENITLKDGVNLSAFSSDGIAPCQGPPPPLNVIILGTTTADFTGAATLSGIQLKTNGATALSMTGSNSCNLTMIDASVYASDSTGITLNNSSSALNFFSCTFRSDSTNNLYTATATGGVDFENCTFNLSSTGTANTIASGRIVFNACDMPGVLLSTSDVGGVFVTACYWQFSGQTILTTAGTGTSEIYNSYLLSGTASTISIGAGTTVNISNCTLASSNTNVITGAGTVNFGTLVFSGSSNNMNVTTQNAFVQRPGIVRNTKQPLFYAYIGSTDSNVTGNGANYQVGTNVAFTEVVDQNNNFNTNGTFTAPYDGNYYFDSAVLLGGVSAAMTNGYLFLVVTTADDFLLTSLNPGATQAVAGIITLAGSAIIPLTAGQTVTLNVQLENGAGNDADILATGGAGVRATWFSGFMIG